MLKTTWDGWSNTYTENCLGGFHYIGSFEPCVTCCIFLPQNLKALFVCDALLFPSFSLLHALSPLWSYHRLYFIKSLSLSLPPSLPPPHIPPHPFHSTPDFSLGISWSGTPIIEFFFFLHGLVTICSKMQRNSSMKRVGGLKFSRAWRWNSCVGLTILPLSRNRNVILVL